MERLVFGRETLKKAVPIAKQCDHNEKKGSSIFSNEPFSSLVQER
jgi:hypothetical protein